MTGINPAAQQGWVKSTDPNSGRVFYANHVTRKTQWEPPENWVEVAPPAPAMAPLPPGWEEMHDPTTGKAFYVDHERKITQWERPVATTSTMTTGPTASAPAAAIFRPSSSTTGASYERERTYSSEAAYYMQPKVSVDVDWSDSLPALEFKVQTVPDSLRSQCPQCDTVFSMSKRRHHCRLCADVICDSCSQHRCELPLTGSEFEKPVRVCDYCYQDVSVGNFFSMRRYLTILLLDGGTEMGSDSNINAALSGLKQDLDQMITSGDSLAEKVTIPAYVLVPAILKQLDNRDTADRAVCCIASLLSLEKLAGSSSDFTTIVFQSEGVFDKLFELLERTNSDRRTLYVQEQAAKALFYITESSITALNDDIALDISRAFRCLLDHTSSPNPNLPRWAAAVVQNLILEDQRRACLAINEVAAKLAAGVGISEPSYSSKLPELIETGGLMMLGSLMSNDDDADARAHAVSACSAALASCRAVQNAQVSLSEMCGTPVTVDSGKMVRAIVSAGGCGSSVAQLVLSADTAVTNMGCSFLLSLVRPLMAAVDALPKQYEYATDNSGLGASREAAIEIATGSALPALVSLVSSSRSLELRCMAIECLATVCVAVGEMGQSWANGQYEEGLERFAAPGKLKDAIVLFNEERVVDCALQVLQSNLGQSLGNAGKETPATRIREGAGLLLSSVTSCSAEAVMELSNRNILSSLLTASSDSGMTAPSTIKMDGSPRCLGVLDTVASLLMFSWQHPSGSSKNLLDSLIEMIDAGAIPFISKVMMARVDWESRSKAVGGMKGRTAACKTLCCLFGIALSDSTGIGMRRLMDAVDADSQLYRSSGNSQKNQTRRTPSNIMEATLGVLQTSSNLARKVLVGDSQSEYSSALMNLVEASLLAAGSICGSSIAPGGSEGILITGDSFLDGRDDSYAQVRKSLCALACDVVIRGGGGSSALLPTMVVGGFGEGCILASLRMALAIAQNGSVDQHAKLALSGILVPISDLLRSALSSGDIYKFSSCLAMIRFCGPHVAAGHGGGLESVRDAIKVATNVLALPSNPNASDKQQQTQETLKAECVSALESLSRNASLWNTISTDALPAVVHYLQVSATSRDSSSYATVCAALRAVLQIVQVPSHALSAAESGIVAPIGALLISGDTTEDIPMLSLQVLHAIAKNDQARARAQFLASGLVSSICTLLGKSSGLSPAVESDGRLSEIVLLGLEVLLFIIFDIEQGLSVDQLFQAPTTSALLNACISDPTFIRSLCSTMLASTDMKIPQSGTEPSIQTEIPNIYGPPLLMVNKKCWEFDSTHHAAHAVLFTLAVFACALEDQGADSFWDIFQLSGYTGDEKDSSRVSSALASHILSLLSKEHKPFVPLQSRKQEEFLTITRPLVRHKLLEILKYSIADLTSEGIGDKFMTDVLVGFNVPHLCLDLWKDPALLDIAYEVIEQIVEQDPDEVLHLFVETKEALISLFDLLNLGSDFDTSVDVANVRRFLANVLSQLAESGLLAEAIERLDARSSAIAALAAACLSEEERVPDEDEDVTESRLSTVLMKCLVDLCTVSDGTTSSSIKLSTVEAMALSKTLGKKICHMVLSRFLERSKLQQYEIDEEDNIIEAPDVAMLCAIAQHDDALVSLRSVGGLHALSLIAAEGELSALEALQKACDGNASVLLEGDTYSSMMGLLAKETMAPADIPDKRKKLETLTFELLTKLVVGSQKGRAAVIASGYSEGCVAAAMEIFSGDSACPTPDPESDIENEVEPTLDDVDEGGEDATKPVKQIEAAEPQPLDSIDVERMVAASAFLASLGRTKVVQTKAIASEEFVLSLKSTAITSPNAELQYAALSLISDLATSVSLDGTLDQGLVVSVLKHFLSLELSFKALKTANTNQVYLCASNLLSVTMDAMSQEDQLYLTSKIVELFKRSCRSCVVTRSTAKPAERAFAADLAYSLTCVLFIARGKAYVDEIFTAELGDCLTQMIQWRKDPKTVVASDTEDTWDAAVENCLTLLSLILWRPDDKLDIKKIASSDLMLVRPGKAPRKAIDLKSALERFSGSSRITANRVIARLYY